MKSFFKSPIALFLLLTSVISALIYFQMFRKGDNEATVALMMWTPAIAAALSSLILKGKLSPYGWKPGKMRYWGYAFLLPLVVALIGYGLMWGAGFTEFYTDEVINYRWARMLGFESPAPFLVGVFSKLILSSLQTSVFVLGEEIGWSAYLIPRMLGRYSVPKTSVISGFIWAIWHYPAIFGGLYGVGAPLWAAVPGFTLVLVGASFIRTVLIVKSKSFWVGMVVHTSHNVVLMAMFYEMTVKTELSPYLVSESGLFLGLVYVIIGVIFWKSSQIQVSQTRHYQ